MAVEIQPSGRSLLATTAIVVFVAIAVYTYGSILTLTILGVSIAVVVYLTWVVGVRVTRRLTGAGG